MARIAKNASTGRMGNALMKYSKSGTEAERYQLSLIAIAVTYSKQSKFYECANKKAIKG
jgi:hypothetical protein